MVCLESEEAKREREFNEEAERLRAAGGCWLTVYTYDEQKKIITGCAGQMPCTNCPAYIDFYRIEADYESSPIVNSPSEALWLTCQFLGIHTRYMCDGQEEEWLKEYKPEQYKANLKRQAYLLDGKEDTYKPQIKTASGQMTIDDLLQEIGG